MSAHASGPDAVRCPECGETNAPDKLDFAPRIPYELIGFSFWPWPVLAAVGIAMLASNLGSTSVHRITSLGPFAPACSMLTLIVAHLLRRGPHPKRSLPVLLVIAGVCNGTLYFMAWIIAQALEGIGC